MWNTSKGDRYLTGAEAALFCAAVFALVEHVKDEDDLDSGYGIQLFDDLTWSQRVAVLEFVATHLLSSSSVPPSLTAVNEAAIGAVFEHISFEVDIEVEQDPPGTRWRQLVLRAAAAAFGNARSDYSEDASDRDDPEDGILPLSEHCCQLGPWHDVVQSLADLILWDRDYEMMGDFLDEAPEKAAMMREIMGIDDNYFAAAAADLNSSEDVQRSLQRLQRLLT